MIKCGIEWHSIEGNGKNNQCFAKRIYFTITRIEALPLWKIHMCLTYVSHVNHMWITCDCSNSTCVSHVGFYMCIFRKGNYSFIILDTTVFLQFIKHLICLLGQDIFEFYFIFRIRSFSTHDHDPIPILKSTTMTARRDSWWMGFIEKWNYDIAAASTALFERNRTFFQLDMATIGLLNDQNLMRYWIIDTYSFASATSSALFAFVAFRALDKRDDNKFTFFL
jgi:hypothetical protein